MPSRGTITIIEDNINSPTTEDNINQFSEKGFLDIYI
jgi:hypothetical protein